MKYGLFALGLCICCCGLSFAGEPKGDVFITNYGLFCFSIQEAERVIVTDPFDTETVELSAPAINPSVVVLSHKQSKRPVFEILKGSYQVVKSNGFYRVMAIPFNGFKSIKGDDNIFYTWKLEDLKFTYLGDFKGFELDTQSLFRLKDTDVLFFPAGNYSDDSMQKVWALIDKIGPIIVIPMYYKIDETANMDAPRKLDAFVASQKDNAIYVEDRVLKLNKNALPKKRTVYVLPYKEVK